ncbi:MAG: RluA family pseudouridine synthase [Candidatus Saccharimonas sp.]
MKITSSDLLAILRRFNEADDSHVPRLIDQVTQSHPSTTNQLVRFRFNRNHYYVLFDETAHDRESYIVEQIRTEKSDATGDLLRNPTAHIDTYGLPFKGKDAYLYKLNTGKQRLDVLLTERFPTINRNTWQKYIKAGFVTINAQLATKASQEVSIADHIATELPKGSDYSQHSLPILYLDDNVIVINKPAGILTHSKGAMNDEFTVAEFFRQYTTQGLDTNRPGIVHRLDRDTSGVMIGARTPEAFDLLKSQFSNRNVKKQYIAIVQGLLKEQQATVDIPIGRNPSAPSTFRPDSKGKPAVTDYTVLATLGDRSLVELWPHTGRTHQLRVHMQYLRTPIVGDRVYGKKSSRLYLHAYSLEVTVPVGERRVFTAPLPEDFDTLFPGASSAVSI